MYYMWAAIRGDYSTDTLNFSVAITVWYLQYIHVLKLQWAYELWFTSTDLMAVILLNFGNLPVQLPHVFYLDFG